jgi:hypothetical protein
MISQATSRWYCGSTRANGWRRKRAVHPHGPLSSAATPLRISLFLSGAACPVGTAFDIHFRIVDDVTGAEVLASECYQFVIPQWEQDSGVTGSACPR